MAFLQFGNVVVVVVVVVIACLKFRVIAMRDILLFGKIFIQLVIFSLFRSESIRKSACVNVCWFSSDKQSLR